jgi:putative endonuclease
MGQLGENLGAAWLQKEGFVILHRNWRHSHYEIDIIAMKGQVLHFVEVKMRSTRNWGLPEDSVDQKKFRKLLEASDQFLYLNPQYRHVQYDVLAISKYPETEIAYLLIEDVYFDPAP